MDLQDEKVRSKAEKISWVVIHRVVGELALSRSIGDKACKTYTRGVVLADELFLWPFGHNQVSDCPDSLRVCH